MSDIKYEVITLKFMSYNKLKLFRKEKKLINKRLFRDFKKLLVLLLVLLKYFNDIQIRLNKLKHYQKFFTLVKGPKCHKKGKHVLKYSYYTNEIIIKKKINFNKNLYNLSNYFFYIISILKLYDSNYNSNNKIIINTYINF